MPVIFKQNPMQTLKDIGVKPQLLAKLSGSSLSVTMEAERLLFSYSDIVSGAKSVINVKKTLLMAAAKDLLPTAERKMLVAQLNTGIEEILMKPVGHVVDVETKSPAMKSTDAGMPSADDGSSASKPAANLGVFANMAKALSEHQPYPTAQLDKGDALPLLDAKGLYAPVRGTDSSSKYFMIAVFDKFRVAVRLKHNKMSIRIEGGMSDAAKVDLQKMGFTNSGKHVSQHMMVTTNEEAQRYLGAALSAMAGAGEGAAMLTPMPQVSIIAGKGV